MKWIVGHLLKITTCKLIWSHVFLINFSFNHDSGVYVAKTVSKGLYEGMCRENTIQIG